MLTESPYTIAHRVLYDLYIKNGPLTREQVQSKLECTPGMFFPSGTTIDNVLDNMVRWELIKRTYKGRKDKERIVPLE